MMKFKLLILVLVAFIAGIFTGLNIPNVDAQVKAPNEQNQPMVSNPGSMPVAAPATGQVNPVTRPMGADQQANPASLEANDVKGMLERPATRASSVDRGATLYSLSSSMQVDIERLEEDVALLKNKINILANMR